MADTIEQADIRTLDIDKVVKGFADIEYVFKPLCKVVQTNGDSIRWYQQTNGDLTATAPSTISNVSPLSMPSQLEVSWTRNTAYPRKYFVSGFLSMEDMKSTDVGAYATTLKMLTRAITKAVDTRIWNVLSESQSASQLNSVTTTSIGGDQWDAGSYAGNPIKDLLRAQRLISTQGYSISNLALLVSPTDYESLLDWIYAKGAQASGWGAKILESGQMTSLLNMDVIVSPNVTADYALIVSKGVSGTWYSQTPTTAVSIENKGLGTEIRVWEEGEAILNDPKSACLIIDTQT